MNKDVENIIKREEVYKQAIKDITENCKKDILECIDVIKKECPNKKELNRFKNKINIAIEMNKWCDTHNQTLDRLSDLLAWVVIK